MYMIELHNNLYVHDIKILMIEIKTFQYCFDEIHKYNRKIKLHY